MTKLFQAARQHKVKSYFLFLGNINKKKTVLSPYSTHHSFLEHTINSVFVQSLMSRVSLILKANRVLAKVIGAQLVHRVAFGI